MLSYNQGYYTLGTKHQGKFQAESINYVAPHNPFPLWKLTDQFQNFLNPSKAISFSGFKRKKFFLEYQLNLALLRNYWDGLSLASLSSGFTMTRWFMFRLYWSHRCSPVQGCSQETEWLTSDETERTAMASVAKGYAVKRVKRQQTSVWEFSATS